MEMYQADAAKKKVAQLYGDVMRRAGASDYGSCPVDLTASFVRLCLSQSCGKCVPCRVGLDRLYTLLEKTLSGDAQPNDLATLRTCAEAIYDSADCAIGYEAAKLVLDGLAAFGDDYQSHVAHGMCTTHFGSVPCSAGCPAHVDIPGYIACIRAGRYADAVRVIRQDNPFPGVCGLICEHPCEKSCRRNVVDDAINIRGLKRYAVEKAGEVPAPACAPKNGKRVGIVGGGPAGLTAAYFLALKGYDVTVYEKRSRLGGMLRYGIPAYRLPDADLDRDIGVILSTGVKVVCGKAVGTDLSYEDFRASFDAVYLSIGAQGAKSLRLPGENAQGVLSAVELLGRVGEGERPDFTGRRVVVVGGGNVAMDATRTARRLGAKSVTCVYRRRIVDMTALPDEVAGAQAEGCEIMQLMAPVRIATEGDRAVALVVKPQLSGPVRDGRPAPIDSAQDEVSIPADIIVVAIGQDIESAPFASAGLDVKRGALLATKGGEAQHEGQVVAGVFTGGDCYTGPATVIRAIDAGKVAAANIDAYFGLHVPIASGVTIPDPPCEARPHWGRVNMLERAADERAKDFGLMERGMDDEAAQQECSRCLRCDRCGYGSFRGGRKSQW